MPPHHFFKAGLWQFFFYSIATYKCTSLRTQMGRNVFFIKQTMSARRCSIRQGSSTISTSSHTAGRAPLSDIRERLGNLRNTTAGRSNTSGKPSVDIWQKSVNATESAASLVVDALLARRARRKALRESTTRNIDIEAPLHDVFTPEVSESQQGVSRAVPGSPQANTSIATPRLLSPLPESTAQKNKNKAVLY